MTVAVKTIMSNPIIGAGIGMNTLAMKEARGGWLPVHNVYLEHGLDLGLPGLVLFLLLLISCLKATVQAQRQCRACDRQDVAALAEGLQVSLLAYAAVGHVSPRELSHVLLLYGRTRAGCVENVLDDEPSPQGGHCMTAFSMPGAEDAVSVATIPERALESLQVSRDPIRLFTFMAYLADRRNGTPDLQHQGWIGSRPVSTTSRLFRTI